MGQKLLRGYHEGVAEGVKMRKKMIDHFLSPLIKEWVVEGSEYI